MPVTPRPCGARASTPLCAPPQHVSQLAASVEQGLEPDVSFALVSVDARAAIAALSERALAARAALQAQLEAGWHADNSAARARFEAISTQLAAQPGSAEEVAALGEVLGGVGGQVEALRGVIERAVEVADVLEGSWWGCGGKAAEAYWQLRYWPQRLEVRRCCVLVCAAPRASIPAAQPWA